MDTINKSSYTKYAMYTALPLSVAAAALAVPVKDKTTKYNDYMKIRIPFCCRDNP